MHSEGKPKLKHVAKLVKKQKQPREVLSNEIKSNKKDLKSLNINYIDLFENSLDGIFLYNLEGNLIDANPAALVLLGDKSEELKRVKLSSLRNDQKGTKSVDRTEFMMKKGSNCTLTEYKLRHKNGTDIYIGMKEMLIYRKNEPYAVLRICRDITEQKKTEAFLKKQENELKSSAMRLEETNTALHVLMEQRQKDHVELEEKITTNLKELVQPYIEKFKQTPLSDRQKAYLELIESGLKEITYPFSRTLKNKYSNLTSTEIRIADMIREGNNSDEIGKIMRISKRTVEFHRNNIRAKLGMRKRKMNLRSYLLSLQ